MFEISPKTWRKNDVEVIISAGKKWLNETQLEHSNLPAIEI